MTDKKLKAAKMLFPVLLFLAILLSFSTLSLIIRNIDAEVDDYNDTAKAECAQSGGVVLTGQWGWRCEIVGVSSGNG